MYGTDFRLFSQLPCCTCLWIAWIHDSCDCYNTYSTILHLQDRARGHSMSTCTNPHKSPTPKRIQEVYNHFTMKPISIEITLIKEYRSTKRNQHLDHLEILSLLKKRPATCFTQNLPPPRSAMCLRHAIAARAEHQAARRSHNFWWLPMSLLHKKKVYEYTLVHIQSNG